MLHRKDLIVVGVHASPMTRYERIKERNREDATLTQDAFMKRDEREFGWGIGNALTLCDCMITNEGSLEDFHQAIKELLAGI